MNAVAGSYLAGERTALTGGGLRADVLHDVDALAALASALQRLVEDAADPNPLRVLPLALQHAADFNRDGRIDLTELTRLIDLYNTRYGTARTGCYAVATTTTEDGFTADPARAYATVVAAERYHSADTNRDGKIGLLELTRVIELYNYRAGTTRTGQYHAQVGTEDGFAVGP